MATIFTRILTGEIPGTFVWRDERAAGFMSINPIAFGHTLVIPVAEYDHWLSAPAELTSHLFDVSRAIGEAQERAFRPERIGLIIAGYEVPHLHVHVIPTHSMADLAFSNAAASVDRAELERAAEAIRAELRAAGHAAVSD